MGVMMRRRVSWFLAWVILSWVHHQGVPRDKGISSSRAPCPCYIRAATARRRHAIGKLQVEEGATKHDTKDGDGDRGRKRRTRTTPDIPE